MKKIMILYKNGEAKSKYENKINDTDIEKAKYFLIFVGNDAESYVIIEPRKYIKFNRGIVEYQLCSVEPNTEEFWCESYPYSPMRININSYVDLITLINSIDRIDLVNYVMTAFPGYIDSFLCLGMTYFGLQLIQNNNIVYEKHYCQKPSSSSIAFDSYKFTKVMGDIYSILKFQSKRKYISLYIHDNNILWSSEDTHFDKYKSLIGINSVISNTITFIPYENYLYLNSLKMIDWEIFVYADYIDHIQKITNSIKMGELNVDSLELILSNRGDVYLYENFHIPRKHHPYLFIDIIASMEFIINAIIMLYKETFISVDQENSKYIFDVILSFKLYENEFKYKKFIINKDSIISLNDILSYMRK